MCLGIVRPTEGSPNVRNASFGRTGGAAGRSGLASTSGRPVSAACGQLRPRTTLLGVQQYPKGVELERKAPVNGSLGFLTAKAARIAPYPAGSLLEGGGTPPRGPCEWLVAQSFRDVAQPSRRKWC